MCIHEEELSCRSSGGIVKSNDKTPRYQAEVMYPDGDGGEGAHVGGDRPWGGFLIRWDPHNCSSFRRRPWHRKGFSFTNHLATPPSVIQLRCLWVVSERLLIPVARKSAPRLARFDFDNGTNPSWISNGLVNRRSSQAKFTSLIAIFAA